MRPVSKIFATLILLSLCPVIFSIQFDLLTFEVWCELEPFIREKETQYPLSREEAAKQLLEEARFIVSGMIYGFTFSYTPYDKARGVREEFILSPIAEIPPGDKNLAILSVWEEDSRLVARMQYQPMEFQISRRNAWLSNAIPTVTGRGEGNLFKSYREKLTAYAQGVKNAIRNHLRPELFNKPRRVTGQALIVEAPQIFITAGKYVAAVKVKLKIQEITPYTVF